jgi:hypothetical protein
VVCRLSELCLLFCHIPYITAAACPLRHSSSPTTPREPRSHSARAPLISSNSRSASSSSAVSLVIGHVPLQPLSPKKPALVLPSSPRAQSSSDRRFSPNQAPPFSGDPCAHVHFRDVRHMLNSCLTVIARFGQRSTHICGCHRDSLPIKDGASTAVMDDGNRFRMPSPLVSLLRRRS